DVALVHNGPMLTTFRVRTTMAVPEDFKFDSMTRSDRSADLVIDSLISLRQVKGAWELRMFNPDVKAISATIHLAAKTGSAKPAASAQRVDCESNPLGQLKVNGGKCKVALKPKQIITVRLG
ncbi:MAG: hypothetical protein ABI222_10140, partial [Opitutaceae bacterium]